MEVPPIWFVGVEREPKPRDGAAEREYDKLRKQYDKKWRELMRLQCKMDGLLKQMRR